MAVVSEEGGGHVRAAGVVHADEQDLGDTEISPRPGRPRRVGVVMTIPSTVRWIG
jgi:hypothetical protein